MGRLAIGTLALATAAASPVTGAAESGLGLLAGRASEPAARDRLKNALASPDRGTRAAAVRVINVSGLGDLVPAVAAALPTESDPLVAAEMIRFLTVLNRPELDQACLEAARFHGDVLHPALADGLGRRGLAASTHIHALRALGFESGAWSTFYRLA